MTATVLLVKLFLASATPQDFDVRATECEAMNYACLTEHDRRVSEIALLARDIKLCDNAVVRRTCIKEFQRFGGEF